MQWASRAVVKIGEKIEEVRVRDGGGGGGARRNQVGQCFCSRPIVKRRPMRSQKAVEGGLFSADPGIGSGWRPALADPLACMRASWQGVHEDVETHHVD